MNADLSPEELDKLVERAMHDTQSRADLLRKNDALIKLFSLVTRVQENPSSLN